MCKRHLAWVLLAALCACESHQSKDKESPSTATAAESAAKPAKSLEPAADQMQLPVLPPVPKSTSNPSTPEKVELGRHLFFDARLSVDGSRSCYSCHQQADGTGGHDPLAVGAQGKQLTRHSPILWNVAYLPKLYWDSRADSLEAQVKGAWAGANMGVGKDHLDEKARAMEKLPGYRPLFRAAFPKAKINADSVAEAISSFERTLICNDTAYDKYAHGDKSALSASQKRGLQLFMGKAGCSTCHTPPYFSIAYFPPGGSSFDVGIGTQGKPEADVDVGRMGITHKQADWAAFKPPTLRNISKSAPYFHDGSVPTLVAAVRLMASGGIDNKNKSSLLRDRHLSDTEISDLIGFLHALDCKGDLGALDPKAKEPLEKGTPKGTRK